MQLPGADETLATRQPVGTYVISDKLADLYMFPNSSAALYATIDFPSLFQLRLNPIPSVHLATVFGRFDSCDMDLTGRFNLSTRENFYLQ